MDPFTQFMLEKAEQRSRALGISNAAVSNFSVCNESGSSNRNALSGDFETTMASQQEEKLLNIFKMVDGDSANSKNKFHVIEKNNKKTIAPQKVLRQFSAVDKENMDLGIEINILADKNVQVQVQVEQDISDQCKGNQNINLDEIHAQPSAKIRDSSRNRLQRLGALYSNTDDLSSPIHRTEGKFHAEGSEDILDAKIRKPNQRLGKLAALANTITQWEDDTAHYSAVLQPDLSDRHEEGKIGTVGSVQKKCETTTSKATETSKHLKWDPIVINSLEAQGFQRRESSTIKMSYEFTDTKDDLKQNICSGKVKDHIVEEKSSVGKINVNKFESSTKKFAMDNKVSQVEKKLPTVKPGLVSGRAAIFESQVQSTQKEQQKMHKDPAELSLKERMKLFEKNKGEALIPKAAFAMAPPISKVIHGITSKQEKLSKEKSNTNIISESKPLPIVKGCVDNKVREKVNALINATAGNAVNEDIKKQREEDLQLLTNRFNIQRNLFNQQQHLSKNSECSENKSIPTPPPPPPLLVDSPNISKRRSHDDAVDDDNKRLRSVIGGIQTRMYPVLCNMESTECSASDNENNCTTATVSALSMTNEINTASQPLCADSDLHNNSSDEREDDDVEDSYMDSEVESEDSSFHIPCANLQREVMQVVENKNKQVTNKTKAVHYAIDDSYIGYNISESSNHSSETSMGVDDYLDEALLDDNDSNEENTSQLSRDSKVTAASNSFSFRKAYVDTCRNNKKDVAEATCSPINQSRIPPVKSEIIVNNENDNMVTLVHTVSFYRKQVNSNSASSTPIRKINREQQVLRSEISKLDTAAENSINFDSDARESDDCKISDYEDVNMVQDKIKKLLDEVCKQQQVISQTSQALNLCAATVEFSGSTESVEGERHLLVATHRRHACFEEVQRLRLENTFRSEGAPPEKGRLIINEITLPLRQDYIRKLSLDTISGHHLVCLIKYNEHVLATKAVPTLPGLLSVKFPDILQLNNVYADFKVTLEIYGMTAQREVLPHEVKYHINFNKKSGIKTPKKKVYENPLVMPPVQSPAGPHAVRTPALVKYGYSIFSLREITRTSWTLTQVLGVSPLEGIVHMKVSCELSVLVEFKGFLNIFDDISGFGAWHRHWCYLRGSMLNYWKYPEDENMKPPMGTIDLNTCISQKVNLASRDVCARLNTMVVECQRPTKETDKESLKTVINGSTTIVRYLISADTKSEREAWRSNLNKSLTLLRAWGPSQ